MGFEKLEGERKRGGDKGEKFWPFFRTHFRKKKEVFWSEGRESGDGREPAFVSVIATPQPLMNNYHPLFNKVFLGGEGGQGEKLRGEFREKENGPYGDVSPLEKKTFLPLFLTYSMRSLCTSEERKG